MGMVHDQRCIGSQRLARLHEGLQQRGRGLLRRIARLVGQHPEESGLREEDDEQALRRALVEERLAGHPGPAAGNQAAEVLRIPWPVGDVGGAHSRQQSLDRLVLSGR